MPRPTNLDAVHSIGYVRGNSHELELTTDFDYDRVDLDTHDEEEAVEPSVSVSDASSALMRCLYWFTAAHGNDKTAQSRLLAVAARCETLLWLLNPTESKFENLLDIATAVGMTKQSLSKSLVNFRDEIGLRLSAGKRAYSRDVYRRAQKSAVAAGCQAQRSSLFAALGALTGERRLKSWVFNDPCD